MQTVLILSESRIQVEPGDQASARVKIRNAGPEVTQYTLDVVGPAAGFSEVVPAEVSVYPGNDVDVTVVFRPERSTDTPSGQLPFGVRAISQEHPDTDRAVVDGDITIGAILAIDAHLTPVESRGRYSGKHRIDFTNHGTGPTRLVLDFVDDDDTLNYKFAPTTIELPAGKTGTAYLKVKTRTPFLRGNDEPRRFSVRYRRLLTRGTDLDSVAPTLPGVFRQKQIISTIVVMAAGLFALVAIAALVYALRPDPEPDPVALTLDAPGPPTAEALASDSVRLTWEPDPSASGQKLETLLVGSSSDDPTVESSTDLGSEIGAHVVEELSPGQKHCFRLVSVNDVGDSEPSAEACADTPAEAAFAAPADVRATAVGPRVTILFTPSDPAAEHVIVDNGVDLETISQGIGEATFEVEGEGEHCFRMRGRIGDELSPLSEKTDAACVDVAARGGEDGEALAPGFAAILTVGSLGDAAIDANAAAQQAIATAQQAGLMNSKLVSSADYDELLEPISPTWALVVDGFATREEALAYCDQLRATFEHCTASDEID